MVSDLGSIFEAMVLAARCLDHFSENMGMGEYIFDTHIFTYSYIHLIATYSYIDTDIYTHNIYIYSHILYTYYTHTIHIYSGFFEKWGNPVSIEIIYTWLPSIILTILRIQTWI
jgi:hypothetical protein